ncbi:hypothetical protein CR513_58714, partial [Mucuna pruriens]
MIKHLNTFKGIVNQLTKTKMKTDDMLQTLINTLVVTLSNYVLEGKLSMNSITNNLLNEESRWRERGLNNHFEANVVENKGRNKNHNKGGYGKSQGRSKFGIRLCCYYYDKSGHRKSECRFLKRDQHVGTIYPSQIGSKKKKKNGITTMVASNDENVFLVEEENYLDVAFDDCILVK